MNAPTTPAAAPARVNVRVLVAGAAVALPLLVVLLFNLGRDPKSVRSPLVGRAAPPFSLAPVGGGETITLESLRGRPAVVNFWATWCVPCFQEHATLDAAARRMTDVQFLGVIYEDDEERTAEFLRQRPISYPSLVDPQGKAAIAFGVFGVPETFFIDRTGRIVEKYVGPLDDRTVDALASRAREAAP